MQRRLWVVGLVSACLIAFLTLPALAAPKVIVQVGRPFWCTVAEVPDINGPQVCIRLDLYPWTQFPVGVTGSVARTASVIALASASCDALKTLVINRMAVEFPTVTVVPEEVWMHACIQ
jgi:hypothetical protein